MNETIDQEILYRLLRDHMDVYAASQTAQIALDSFISALKRLKCSKKDMRRQVLSLIDTIKKSKPRSVSLINLISVCEKEVRSLKLFDNDYGIEEIKNAIAAIVEKQIAHLNENIDKLVELGIDYIENGDFIIVHSVSKSVRSIIPEAKRRGKDFRILILKQDFKQTRQVMKHLDKYGIEYIVTPEYGLAHFMGQANKLFLGAVAVTDDFKVVGSMGTACITSVAHLNKLPVYLFINSLALSDVKSENQNIHMKKEVVASDGAEFVQFSHSHDIVDLNLIDHLIIEEGEIDKMRFKDYRARI